MNDNSVKPAPIESVNNSEGANGALSVEKPVLIPIEGEEKFDPEAGPVAPSQPSVVQASYLDIFKQFVWMGWTAFGGPAAHIALFQKVCTGFVGSPSLAHQLPNFWETSFISDMYQSELPVT